MELQSVRRETLHCSFYLQLSFGPRRVRVPYCFLKVIEAESSTNLDNNDDQLAVCISDISWGKQKPSDVMAMI